jgi:hypothetical protein
MALSRAETGARCQRDFSARFCSATRQVQIRFALTPRSTRPRRERERASTVVPPSTAFSRTTTSSVKPYTRLLAVASIHRPPRVAARADVHRLA